jgi:hypothetical protein
VFVGCCKRAQEVACASAPLSLERKNAEARKPLAQSTGFDIATLSDRAPSVKATARPGENLSTHHPPFEPSSRSEKNGGHMNVLRPIPHASPEVV